MRDFPFMVYFDFETTTSDSVINVKKMYVISYCQVYAFHPGLKIPKMSIFRSFQQDFKEITSLDHFFQEHAPFFDQVTMAQMKDAAVRVLYSEEMVALAELFALELKFIKNTIIKWFNVTQA